jgi:hypothetical protein
MCTIGQGADVDTDRAACWHHIHVPTVREKQTSIFFFFFFFLLNLNHFLTQSLLVAAAWCPKALQPCSLPHPPPALEIFIYYLWESILFGNSGFYFSTGFDRYSGNGRWEGGGTGRGGGESSRAFGFVLCCGGSVKFSGAVGPGGPCK